MTYTQIRLLLLIFSIVLLPFASKAQQFRDNSAEFTEAIKTKEQHFSGIIHRSRDFFYTFGSETSNPYGVSPDHLTKGNSFISKYDINTFKKVQEWDLGEISYLEEELDLDELIYAKNRGFGIFHIKKKRELIYVLIEILPNGSMNKPSEIFRVNKKDIFKGLHFAAAPDSSHQLLRFDTRDRSTRDMTSTFIVLNEAFNVVLNKALEVRSENENVQFISQMAIDKRGNVFYTTYENDIKRNTKYNINLISNNLYHFYSMSSKGKIKHFAFENENKVFHNLDIQFDRNGDPLVLGFYSDIDYLNLKDKEVPVEGFVAASFKDLNFSTPKINYSIFENSFLRNSISAHYSTGRPLPDARAKLTTYSKSFFEFPHLMPLENGGYILTVDQHRRLIDNDSRLTRNTATYLMTLNDDLKFQQGHVFPNTFSASSQFLKDAHLLVKKPDGSYIILFETLSLDAVPEDLRGFKGCSNALVRVDLDSEGNLLEEKTIMAFRGATRVMSFDYDQHLITGRHRLMVPVYKYSRETFFLKVGL